MSIFSLFRVICAIGKYFLLWWHSGGLWVLAQEAGVVVVRLLLVYHSLRNTHLNTCTFKINISPLYFSSPQGGSRSSAFDQRPLVLARTVSAGMPFPGGEWWEGLRRAVPFCIPLRKESCSGVVCSWVVSIQFLRTALRLHYLFFICTSSVELIE